MEHSYASLEESKQKKIRQVCCAPQCGNGRTGNVTFHRFPKDAKIKKAWQVNLGIGKDVSDCMIVCSDHFDAGDYKSAMPSNKEVRRRRRLRRCAVPSKKLPFRPLNTEASPRQKEMREERQGTSVVASNPLELPPHPSSALMNVSLPRPMPGGGGGGGQPPPNATQLPGFMPLPSRTSLYSPMYSYCGPGGAPPQIPTHNYPTHPDVTLKRLPFFETMGELLKPSSLTNTPAAREQMASFYFYLTSPQATAVGEHRTINSSKNEYTVQVLMRFCVCESSCEQEDSFPPGLAVKVNGKVCNLPGPISKPQATAEPKRPPRPVNISQYIKICPFLANQVVVSWAPDYTRNTNFCVAIFLVRKLTTNELLDKLNAKGVRHPDITRKLIKDKLTEDDDSEIATTSLRVSLQCPLSKMKMTVPCRPTTCTHLQCFDACTFLQMNEKKPTWACPVCDKPALFDNLVIDGYFQEVLASPKLPSDSVEVQLHQDGSWSAHVAKKESTVDTNAKNDSNVQAIDLDDNDESQSSMPDAGGKASNVGGGDGAGSGGGKSNGEGGGGSSSKSEVMIDLTSTDEEDEGGPSVPASTGSKAGNTSPKTATTEASPANATTGEPLTQPAVKDNTDALLPKTISPPPPVIINLDSPSPPPLTADDLAPLDLPPSGGVPAVAGSEPSLLCTPPPSLPDQTSPDLAVPPVLVPAVARPPSIPQPVPSATPHLSDLMASSLSYAPPRTMDANIPLTDYMNLYRLI